MSEVSFIAEHLLRKWAARPTLAKEDPASAPTLPGHGSTHPSREKEMNKQKNTAPFAQSASDEDWQAISYEHELALDRIALLATVADRLLDAHPDFPRVRGQVTLRYEEFCQVSALLGAIRDVAKLSLEPA